MATAGLVLTAGTLTPVQSETPAMNLSADTTALIVCGTTCPTPDDITIDIVKNQYIAPTHPGDIDYVPVTTPEEFWPITGIFRLLGLALGDPRLFGLGGPAWPDEPWWKLTGLFDLTANRSLQKGADSLEAAVAANENDHRVIYGISQGAGVANVVKRRLAEQYPAGTEGSVPDIDFVLSGDPNLPNGGLASRFAGVHIPILDLLLNGPAATDTPFDTVEIARQYDGFTDFPLYPLNLLADLNAILGLVYVHMYSFDVSLPAKDPTTSPAYRGTFGDTSYYVFDNPDLPLFGPLRTLGVPEPLIDVVEPFFRVLVELGYDRSIPPWEPTVARLIPKVDPAKLIVDLVNAVGQGINNALAVVGLPPLLKIPEPPRPATRADDVGTGMERTAGAEPVVSGVGLGKSDPPRSESARDEAEGTSLRTGLDAMASAAEGGPESTGVPQPGESLAADDVPSKDTAVGGASPPVIGSERVEPTSQPPEPRHLGRDSFDAPERPSVVSRHSVDATRTSGSGTTETAIAGHSVTADGTDTADEPPSAGTPVAAHRWSSGPSLQREPRDGGPRTTENRGPSGTSSRWPDRS
ncbi:PE-PPE domain-containing protein [Mycolicibacterium vaccae]|uniref:PE family protein n=1 Tax=Mycolicibacterium vaccae ATCC 25954 TaxID=1194972 RepID=K0UZY5_MYCVA|nr:PE-PPE domain-containing protein [Mycolicibacterium vaccae]EJZ12326.1 PE family protein [Mycolicibacterium vaccae ATCC 25954]